MKGIIIAGGLGTRLRPLTYQRPKPLVPVANRPFLEYQVALLRKHGITDIVFATNYMAEQIEGHFGNGSRFGVKMQYAVEHEPLGTGGAIRNAAQLIPNSPVVVFNGDVLMDFDLREIVAFHQERHASATITLTEVPSPNPFGVLYLTPSGEVERWEEPTEELKKRLSLDRDIVPTGKDYINAGCYILERSCIDRIPADTKVSIERDTYPQMIAARAGVYGYSAKGYWIDLGHAEQLLYATQAVLSGAVRTAAAGMSVGEGTTIAPTTWINGLTAIGKQCRIAGESRLENCIVMDNVTVGSNVRLYGIIVDENVIIEDEVVITGRGGGNSVPVIAAGSVLTRGTRLQL